MIQLQNWQKVIMARGELYLVGGAVRDRLLGRAEKPVDADYLVRGLPPHDLEEILSRWGSVLLVGRSFGVYKFTPREGGGTVDVAFPRREVSTGPGHRDFAVEWDWALPVEEDLARRDFTLNAMARDLRTGRLVDPFGGSKDIEARLVRMVFPRAFREDPLRILRGIRIAARFGFTIESDTWEAMKREAAGIDNLSAERIQEEMTKLLTQCSRPSAALELMHHCGVLGRFFPELDRTYGSPQNEYHPDDLFWHSLRTCDCTPRGDLVLRWTALLHDLGKALTRRELERDGRVRVVFYGHQDEGSRIAGEVLGRLRYAKPFIARCRRLIENHMFNYTSDWSDAAVRRLMRKVGRRNVERLLALREADGRSRGLSRGELEELSRRIEGEIEKGSALSVRDLAIGGREVMEELSLGPGPMVGMILEGLLKRVVEDPSLNTREKLLELARRMKT